MRQALLWASATALVILATWVVFLPAAWIGNAVVSWPAGPRDSDGIWAKYWYESVWNSTGFAPYREKPPQLNQRNRAIASDARPYYETLYQHRLQP